MNKISSKEKNENPVKMKKVLWMIENKHTREKQKKFEVLNSKVKQNEGLVNISTWISEKFELVFLHLSRLLLSELPIVLESNVVTSGEFVKSFRFLPT